MSARQVIVPGAMPSRDGNGRSLPAKLWFYAPGSGSVPKAVYTSSALTTAHAFPIVSDSAGRFPQMFAEETEYYDVVWGRLDNDALIRSFADIRPLNDGVTASAMLAESAADAAIQARDDVLQLAGTVDQLEAYTTAAASSAAAAETSRMTAMSWASASLGHADDAEDAQIAAEAAKVAAQLARDQATAIVGFDPSLYQTRSEAGQPLGYAPLNASSEVAEAYLTTIYNELRANAAFALCAAAIL